ncbi:hypothetical protein MHK_010276 [Candidatus Magnetomorum sp. HK-1]|nr:hypothetical protein MHK_010276 [Candidatus Magnetomorum sp. HK-1]
MSIVRYQYKRSRHLKMPIITIAIESKNKWFPVEAYVDSGATYSVFTAQIADYIGLSYREGVRKYVQVGNGALIPIYLHDLQIQVGKNRIIAPIGFSEKLGINFNLLGRVGFFDFFQVCFDEKNYLIQLIPFDELA